MIAWARRHPDTVDAALAAVLLAAALVSSHINFEDAETFIPGFEVPATAGVVVGLAATILPLAVRRRFPLGALAAATIGFLVARIVFDSIEASITAIALPIAVYSAAAYGDPRRRNWVCAASLVAVMGELYREVVIAMPPPGSNAELNQAIALLQNVALFGGSWALGGAIGAGRRRAAVLESEREERARRAVFDERVRIARELHDVVAHHVSVMGVQAGAARLVMQRDPAQVAEALGSIEASSRQAVSELYRLLGFLRQAGDDEGVAPHAGLEQLPELAAHVAGGELEVDVRVEGEQRPLPPTVEASAYRIIQEALTNTLKHAGATRADVRLRYCPDRLEVEVIDDGREGGNGAIPQGGLGLVGMRERAALHGGIFAAGPRPEGGFAVLAELPVSGRAP